MYPVRYMMTPTVISPSVSHTHKGDVSRACIVAPPSRHHPGRDWNRGQGRLQEPSRLPHRNPQTRYSETVCTTLPTGRVLATGSFMSLTSASSYSARVCSGALAFI